MEGLAGLHLEVFNHVPNTGSASHLKCEHQNELVKTLVASEFLPNVVQIGKASKTRFWNEL